MTHRISLGAVSPTSLEMARLDVHWAVQPLAAFGQSFVTPVADDSHRSLEWNSGLSAFFSEANAEGVRIGLRPADLTLMVHGGGLSGEMTLISASLEDAYTWLAGLLGVETMPRPEYEMPRHHGGNDVIFGHDSAAFAELARWYDVAAQVIGRVQDSDSTASALRVWPHHFDIATLLTVSPEKDDQPARTIGVGMTPGDGSYPEPYFYVGPYPHPEYRKLPSLAGNGHWHTEGWFGAVLTGSELVAVASATAQQENVDAFYDSAIVACRRLLRNRAPSTET